MDPPEDVRSLKSPRGVNERPTTSASPNRSSRGRTRFFRRGPCEARPFFSEWLGAQTGEEIERAHATHTRATLARSWFDNADTLCLGTAGTFRCQSDF